jgi:hypothetical protein
MIPRVNYNFSSKHVSLKREKEFLDQLMQPSQSAGIHILQRMSKDDGNDPGVVFGKLNQYAAL